ncbi:hypothetical protein LIER_04179 [Lithospermum erythrorhizon]|uniref:Uncharacterized protein n=1 Tax=Lithospermum erythrorhizon TaxID=34254 RepID=A0AAV3NYL6_LITER
MSRGSDEDNRNKDDDGDEEHLGIFLVSSILRNVKKLKFDNKLEGQSNKKVVDNVKSGGERIKNHGRPWRKKINCLDRPPPEK